VNNHGRKSLPASSHTVFRIGDPRAPKVVSQWEGYVTDDGRYVLIRDYELTTCDCPESLCPHDNGEMEEEFWYIFPNTPAGERMGLGDALARTRLLRDGKKMLVQIMFEADHPPGWDADLFRPRS
jgi:hypothetical protein